MERMRSEAKKIRGMKITKAEQKLALEQLTNSSSLFSANNVQQDNNSVDTQNSNSKPKNE
jgi:hypothetical protein